MITISVCVGSSCHVHGSAAVIRKLQALIESEGLEEDVLLKGVFCQGRCTEPVTLDIAGTVYSGVDSDSVAELFLEEILPRVGRP